MTQTAPAAPLIAIVVHSPFGHTRVVAEQLAQGIATVPTVRVRIVPIEEGIPFDWETVDQATAVVLASPVYMGSVTAPFKLFMDQSSKRWQQRRWAGKLAAGVVNSGGLSGDKLATLQQLNLFAMQHGMIWAGLPLMNEGHGPEHRNRMAGFLGLMTQSDNAATTETPPEGDRATARWFGRYLATLAASWPSLDRAARDRSSV